MDEQYTLTVHKGMNEIIPNLWISDQNIMHNDIIKKNNIKYIINLTENIENTYPKIKYMQFHIKDQYTCSQDVSDIFDMSLDTIYKALNENAGILIHCDDSYSKSSAIVAAFLIRYLKLDYVQATVYIKNIIPRSFKKDTCISRGLFSYYLHNNKISCNK